MGFYLAKPLDLKCQEYIGSQTIYNCADKGAFSFEVNNELENFVNENESVIGALDAESVPRFLKILKEQTISGRDVQLLIETIESNYMDGFMILQ